MISNRVQFYRTRTSLHECESKIDAFINNNDSVFAAAFHE